MAAGDVFAGLSSVNSGATLDIQPGSGVEVVITTIFHEDSVDLQWYDGTNTLTFAAALTGPNSEAGLGFACTNARRIRVKNNAGTAKLIGYSGFEV